MMNIQIEMKEVDGQIIITTRIDDGKHLSRSSSPLLPSGYTRQVSFRNEYVIVTVDRFPRPVQQEVSHATI